MLKLLKIVSGSDEPISAKHGMYHHGLRTVICCINHDLRLNLTNYTEWTNFVACCLKVGRYRYMYLLSYRSVVSIQGQGHFLTLTKCYLHIKFKINFLRLKMFDKAKLNFMCGILRVGEPNIIYM